MRQSHGTGALVQQSRRFPIERFGASSVQQKVNCKSDDAMCFAWEVSASATSDVIEYIA